MPNESDFQTLRPFPYGGLAGSRTVAGPMFRSTKPNEIVRVTASPTLKPTEPQST